MTNIIPKLRFPEFVGEWEEKRTGNYIDFLSGFPFKGEDISEDASGIPLLRGVNITEGVIRHNAEIDKYYLGSLERLDKYVIHTNDLVIGMDGSKVGKNSALVTEKDSGSLLIQRVARLRQAKGSSISFIYQHINSNKFYRYVDRVKTSSGIPHISAKQINDFKIFFPSLPEQQKIADFLSSVDSRISQLTKKKSLLEKYKKGIMQKIFKQEIRFKDDNGNDFPDWQEKKLGDIAEKVNDKNKTSLVRTVFTNSAIHGIINQQDYFDKDIANQDNLGGYYIVSKNDFVYNPRISKHAPVGPIKRNQLNTGVMSPLYTVFRFSEGNLKYLNFYFDTTGWHRYMNQIANIGARHDRMNITNGDFFKMPIPYPCQAEQQKIADFLSAIGRKIDLVNTELAKTQEFKKGLLQQMFV